MPRLRSDDCPCGRRDFAHCCGPLLDGSAPAADAESLMRSRYSAFVLGNTGYLLASWHATTRPDADTFALEPETRWLGLEVRATKTLDSNHAEVEFVARYRREGRGHRLHEISRFVLEGGHWSYVDGTHPEKAKDRP